MKRTQMEAKGTDPVLAAEDNHQYQAVAICDHVPAIDRLPD
jgi:hypothetical protein